MELKNNQENISPIFIIGSPRSGTTLLRLMLSAHSNITIPHEYTLVENVINSFETDVIPRKQVLNFLEKQYRHSHFLDWKIDKKTLLSKFSKNTYSRSDIINIIYVCYLSIHTPLKNIWGDKNINSLSFISEISVLFPNAKFIHIIRDGRDVAASLQSRKWGFYSFNKGVNFYIKHYKGAMLTWKTSIERIETGLARLPKSSYITVRYEDLIEDTEKYLKDICSFLNVEYELEMLHYYKNEKTNQTISSKRLKGTHENTLKPIITGNKKKYLTFYTNTQLAVIESIGTKQLINNGYILESADKDVNSFDLIKANISYTSFNFFYSVFYRSKQILKKIIK